MTERAIRSVGHQMSSGKFSAHRDLAGFEFEISPVNRKLLLQLAETTFTEAAHNVVLVGGPGTGKSHLATAIGVADITRHGKRVHFYSTVDLVNALEQEKVQGKAGRIAGSMLCLDAVVNSPTKCHSSTRMKPRPKTDRGLSGSISNPAAGVLLMTSCADGLNHARIRGSTNINYLQRVGAVSQPGIEKWKIGRYKRLISLLALRRCLPFYRRCRLPFRLRFNRRWND